MNKDIEKISEGNHKTYSELIETLEKVKDAIKKQNYGIAMDILCKPYPAFQVITLSSGLKESEGEKIRKALVEMVNDTTGDSLWIDYNVHKEDALDWLEKQGGKDEEILILKDQIESLYAAIKAIKETHRIELEKRGENSVCKVKIGETYKCIASPRYTCFRMGDIYHVEDNFVAELINTCSGCFVLLEKQGEQILANSAKTCEVEQKSADKVEPKFHEGEWVVYECGEETATLQITRIVGETYVFSDDSTLGVVDEDTLRLWDITKDAKDGDVLVCESGWTCIFKTLVNDETFSSYCFMDNTKWFCETGSECHTLKEEFVKAYNGKIYPATKEQRDLLFQKMHEAGYEWDADAKVLKEIEQKSAEWTKEDIQMYRNILTYLSEPSALKEVNGKSREQLLDWFKGFKDRYTWKPSDAQMDALRYVFQHYTPTATEKLAWDALQTLELLLEKFKELREE